MEEVISNKEQSGKWIRWTARGIGLIASIFWLLMIIGSYTSEETKEPISLEGIILTVLIIIEIIGLTVAWKNEKIGGTIMIIGAIALFIFAYITAGHNKHLAMLFSGGPFLITGILFRLSWQKSKR